MRRRIFVISVSGGLCNRLRVLICAASYSEKHNCILLVRWPIVDGFQATLPDLFDCPYRIIGEREDRIFRYLARRFDGLHMDLNYEGRKTETLSFKAPRFVTYLETIEKFGEPYLDTQFAAFSHRLIPVPAIQSNIRAFDDFLRSNTVVGVSVRSTRAHPKTIEASPTRWFIERINFLHRLAPHIKVFLSGDDAGVGDHIRRSVTCPIVALDKPFAFNSTESIRDAVADLYLLGRTKYILGSYWSSFSETAFEMRGDGAFETSQSRSMDDSRIAALLNAGV